MSELSPEVKKQLHEAIDASDIEGVYESLRTVLRTENPDTLEVEFTKTQMDYLREKAKAFKIGDEGAVLRFLVDGVMKGDPSTKLGKGRRK